MRGEQARRTGAENRRGAQAGEQARSDAFPDRVADPAIPPTLCPRF